MCRAKKGHGAAPSAFARGRAMHFPAMPAAHGAEGGHPAKRNVAGA